MDNIPEPARLFFEESGYKLLLERDHSAFAAFKTNIYKTPDLLSTLDKLLYNDVGYWERFLILMIDSAAIYNQVAINNYLQNKAQGGNDDPRYKTIKYPARHAPAVPLIRAFYTRLKEQTIDPNCLPLSIHKLTPAEMATLFNAVTHPDNFNCFTAKTVRDALKTIS